MTERTIVWVDESLLLNNSKRRSTNVIQSHTPSKPVKYGSFGKRVQMTDTMDANNKSYKWVRCYLLGGHITDTELSVEVSLATEEWQVGQKMTIVQPQPGTVLMGNSDLMEPPNDLITLPHLNEPSVVFALQSRYESNTIYTSTGPILLALNPFQSVPTLYDETTRLHYWRHGEGLVDGDLEPHVYANADCAFRQMLRGIGASVMSAITTNLLTASSSSTSIDQSILVSGESGAGKTVTTKHIMSYLAMLSERKAQHDSEQHREHPRRAPSPGRRNEGLSLVQSPPPSLLTRRMSSRRFGWNAGAHIEQKILESNPILESFGNARTIRNDNSSRFGKFIELQFKQTGSLIGAVIETYLLEKIRLVHQTPGERNFHIFYELLSGITDDEKELFFLKDYSIQDFKLTNQSGTYDRRDGVIDSEMLEKLVNAMTTMGIDSRTQDDIFRCTAAFMHASNLTFEEIDDDSCKLDDLNPHLQPTLQLLGLEKDDFEQALCQFEIEAGSTSYTRTINREGAQKGLEALIKSTYGSMFNYIAQSINKKIDFKMNKLERSISKAAFIGVLDIFGFESFDTNSFEQLCINYCNEALQQQFNLHIFKSEQEEYKKEGIAWEFIEFPDNQDVIDLVDKRGVGIIPLLNDQCRTTRGSDKSFAEALYTRCSNNPRFHAPSLVKGKQQFIVDHYAGPVTYNYVGFVEKNKDEVPRRASNLLEGSSVGFVQLLGGIAATPSSERGIRPTVGGHFTRQLGELRKRIDQTIPHYIRCLKPNHALIPNRFDKAMIADQLRYAGVLEAIRVSRVGYSQRYSHETFFHRYQCIAASELQHLSSDALDNKINTLIRLIEKRLMESARRGTTKAENVPPKTGIQKGLTQIFLRQPLFEYIEKLRMEKLNLVIIRCQALARRFLERNRYLKLLRYILLCQACVRRYLAIQLISRLRKTKAAIKIQSQYRSWSARKILLAKKRIALWCQRMTRGQMGRRRYQEHLREYHIKKELEARQNTSATTLQSTYRRYVAKKRIEILKDRIVTKRSSFVDKDLQSEAVVILKQQQKKAALQADKAAAIAVQTKHERKIEVEALRQELDDASCIAMKARQMEAELALVRSEANSLRKELEFYRSEAETAKTSLAMVMAENAKLKEQIQSGGGSMFLEHHRSNRYSEYHDLQELNDRIQIYSKRSKEGRKDLDRLVQALSVLR